MDTVSIILVPEEVREDTLDRMSPRVNKIYKKNLKNIFEFNHETFEKLEVIKSYINAGKGKIYPSNQQYSSSYFVLNGKVFNDYK